MDINMIDCHSHFLAEMDDGAKSFDMTRQILADSFDQGVNEIISTSHCYPRSEGEIEHFLKKREKALEQASFFKGPKIHKGCEVHLTCDISEFSNIKKLCIENTNYMLLELPYDRWSPNTGDFIYSLKLLGVVPVLAHIERFFMNEDMFEEIFSLGVYSQVNANTFLEKSGRKLVEKLIEYGQIHVIGSDCHNLTSRKTHMKKAYDIIREEYGGGFCDYLTQNAQLLLQNKPLESPPKIEKKSIFNIFKRKR